MFPDVVFLKPRFSRLDLLIIMEVAKVTDRRFVILL